MDYAVVMVAPDIYHHGIKGQKWGVRRFQNKDGSLTAAGKKRYDDDGPGDSRPKSGQRETAVKFAESRIVDGKKEVSYMMTDMEKYFYEHRNEWEQKQLKMAKKIKVGMSIVAGFMASTAVVLPVVAIHNIRKYY